jgi:hypothetical protein
VRFHLNAFARGQCLFHRERCVQVIPTGRIVL